ncbi:phosphinothricin acetyltransferase [Mesocricetibacter intestinalis]|uniref:Phosphinothricin acetyltransferase n=1 Tax=Mesocricetibacter intestinalis TaxID=1521930 RepID=A0A4V3D9G7_9PAST|nr:GNAT family N-acetyltransferase [Mesocricetibacter intestinalis]TDQ56649.1 phosphinothricin acetyltransferase [Mesocricetibacter intestinalis]
MIIRKATEQDYASILDIYNQAIPCRRITADLTPVTPQSRRRWFDFHLSDDKYPLWVINEEKNEIQRPADILGWGSFSPFYPREAFDNTAEISIYLDPNATGKGLGSKLLHFMIEQMAPREIHTLMAYVIEENQVSRRMFEKQGFSQWGRYPHIANMGDSLQTFLMYGFQQGIENLCAATAKAKRD